MEYYPLNNVNVFAAKVSATKTKINGQSYVSYRLTVPKKTVEKMNIKDGDYLLIIAKKASWFHLLEWDDEHFNMLPENIRLELSAIQKAQEAEEVSIQIGATKPQGGNLNMEYSACGNI